MPVKRRRPRRPRPLPFPRPADAKADARPTPRRRVAASGASARCSASPASSLLAGLAYGVYYALVLNHYESTDNAYVQGNVVQLTPQVGGTVVAINADDTDFVKAGQLLVKLDPADARVALDQAEAQLAQTVREVRTLFVNNGALEGADRDRARPSSRARRARSTRAQDDVNRRAPLVADRRRRQGGVQPCDVAARGGQERARGGAIGARSRRASSWLRTSR